MRLEVFTGQLTYVDTKEGRIRLTDRHNREVTGLDITSIPNLHWEELVGGDIEAIVIDGKTKDLYPIIEEQ